MNNLDCMHASLALKETILAANPANPRSGQSINALLLHCKKERIVLAFMG